MSNEDVNKAEIDEIFDCNFDWSILPHKSYKQNEIERDIKMCISDALKKREKQVPGISTEEYEKAISEMRRLQQVVEQQEKYIQDLAKGYEH